MSSLKRHPDADNLWRYADGELPARQARREIVRMLARAARDL